MSHTIVRETSNEAGGKILRGKSLNSGVGILNSQSLNSMRKSFVGASGWWEGENKTQEEEKIERVTEMGCDNVSFGLVSLHRWRVNVRAARRRKAGGEGWSTQQEQEVVAKRLEKTDDGLKGCWFTSWSGKSVQANLSAAFLLSLRRSARSSLLTQWVSGGLQLMYKAATQILPLICCLMQFDLWVPSRNSPHSPSGCFVFQCWSAKSHFAKLVNGTRLFLLREFYVLQLMAFNLFPL